MKKEIQERIESIKNNRLPKGYRRVKDIGIAPEEWTLGKLSDVIENVSRPVPKPKEPYWRLGIKSWAKGTFHAFVDDPETVNMDELYEVKENDLIVNITFAWEHAIAIAKKEDEGLLVSHRFPTYVFKDEQIPDYYQAVIAQQYFKDMLEHISPGGAGRNRVLNRKDFLNLPCYIPSLTEQRKLAEILSTCDHVIELKQQLFAEKRKQKQWLTQILLDPNSGVRLPGFENSIWAETPLSTLCKFVGGGTPDTSNEDYWNGTIPWLSSSDLEDDNIRKVEATRYITDNAIKHSATKFCPKDSILIVTRVGVGKIAIAPFELCTSQDFTNLVDVNGNLYFIALQLKRQIQRILTITQGTSIKGIASKEIRAMIINLPTKCEQDAIAKILECFDREMVLLENEVQAWQQKKKALMQLLLTGLMRTNN